MSITLQEIEQKIEAAVKQFTENQNLLNDKVKQIEQLNNDKTTIMALLHQLNGYITAFQDVKKTLAPVVPAESAAAISSPLSAPAAAETVSE